MTAIIKVVNNRNLLTNIFEYLEPNEIKQMRTTMLRSAFHYDYLMPQHNTLLYGQVQSGKTSKIMEYIKTYRPDILKIIIIQNNVRMLYQYKNALLNNEISCEVIDSKASVYKNSNVLITIYNKYRIHALEKFLSKNGLRKYCLVLDESDQYLKKIKETTLFNNSKHVLHVTATPFNYAKNHPKKHNVDNLIAIKPPANYVGIDKVKIVPIEVRNNTVHLQDIHVKNIMNDFIKVDTGFMLINSYSFIADMKRTGLELSIAHPTIPFVVLSSKSYLYMNGSMTKCDMKNVQKGIDKLNKYPHIVIIANRLSFRGINYTNASYSRHITHQITKAGNYTNFLQKCRIFGVRNENSDLSRGTIYCIINMKKPGNHNFVNKLKTKVSAITNQVTNEKVIQVKPKKITVQELKQLCRENKIKKFSKLRREQLIELLTSHNIDLTIRNNATEAVTQAETDAELVDTVVEANAVIV